MTDERMKPEDKPVPLASEFKMPEGIVFHTCTTPGCGEESLRRGPCWKCTEKREAKNKAKKSIEDSIPKIYRWARFEDPRVRQYVGAAFERVNLEARQGHELIERAHQAIDCARVVLQGSSGKGKTTLAICMMRAWTEKTNHPGLFVYAPDLQVSRLRVKNKEPDLILEALAAPLLVIDDVGAGTMVAGPLEEVVHKRHHDGKTTWFTTWMLSLTVAQRFGGGFTRRVFEEARVIDLLGAK